MRYALLALITVLAGCRSLGYYAHVTHGQAALLAQRRSIDKLKRAGSDHVAAESLFDGFCPGLCLTYCSHAETIPRTGGERPVATPPLWVGPL